MRIVVRGFTISPIKLRHTCAFLLSPLPLSHSSAFPPCPAFNSYPPPEKVVTGCIPVLVSNEAIYAFSTENGGDLNPKDFSVRITEESVSILLYLIPVSGIGVG